MVLVLAMVSAVSLGVADYLAGVTLRRDGRTSSALTYTALSSLVGVVVVVAAIPIVPPETFTRGDALWAVAAGGAFGVALPLLMVGMARGPVALVAPVIGLVSLAVPAVVGPLLGDQLTALEVAGLLLALPATGMVAMTGHSTSGGFTVGRAIALAAVTGAFLGSAAIFFGQTSPESGVGPAVVAQITVTVFLVTIASLTGYLVRPQRAALTPDVGVGLLSAIAVLCSVLAFQRGSVAIVAAVIGLAPGPTVLLAWLLTNERINRIQLIGFVLGICAVVLFALG